MFAEYAVYQLSHHSSQAAGNGTQDLAYAGYTLSLNYTQRHFTVFWFVCVFFFFFCLSYTFVVHSKIWTTFMWFSSVAVMSKPRSSTQHLKDPLATGGPQGPPKRLSSKSYALDDLIHFIPISGGSK